MNSIAEFIGNLPEEVKYFGSNENCLTSTMIRAGRLSLIYENGSIRYLTIGRHEIIRMIYSAVRDENWLTVLPVLSDQQMEIHQNSFSIRYTCRYISGDIDFVANYSIEGRQDNTIIFEMNGEAFSSFYKNRIGFCVLHPIEEITGSSCTIIHHDQSEEMINFPRNISPYQPFKGISAMKWNCSCDIQASIVFSGDVFETEDQRNWTDASFKTYCTPLDLPYPVFVKKGERFYQKILLTVNENERITIVPKEELSIRIFLNDLCNLPSIGIGRSTRKEPLQREEIQILQTLPFDHYRVDLYLFSNQWVKNADEALREAIQLEYSLELALFFGENAQEQASAFCEWARVVQTRIRQVCIFHKSIQSTPDNLLLAVMPVLRLTLPHVMIGAGTNANFAQLNRSKVTISSLDFIVFSIHPQEHAYDNSTLVENLVAQKYVIQSARQFSDGKKIHVSPVNLKRRFNANIENFEHPVDSEEMFPQADNRQMSLFAADWTLASIKYLCESGVNSFTFYETTGERGLIQGNFATNWPEKFHSVPGMIFPVFYIFNFLLKQKSSRVIKSLSSDPLSIEVLTMIKNDKLLIVIVNFKSENRFVNIPDLKGVASMRSIDATNFDSFVTDCNWYETKPCKKISFQEPILIHPYAINFIEQL